MRREETLIAAAVTKRAGSRWPSAGAQTRAARSNRQIARGKMRILQGGMIYRLEAHAPFAKLTGGHADRAEMRVILSRPYI
jgi:hypothetical protein